MKKFIIVVASVFVGIVIATDTNHQNIHFPVNQKRDNRTAFEKQIDETAVRRQAMIERYFKNLSLMPDDLHTRTEEKNRIIIPEKEYKKNYEN
jgi:hypothetical protein